MRATLHRTVCDVLERNGAVTLIDRLGGPAAVEAVVADLSDRILEHPELGRYFAGLDYDAIVAHRRAYMVAILGGPEQYSGASMREAHQHLRLSNAHMDAFLELLDATLTDAGVSDLDSAHVRKEVDRLRPAIVAATVRRPATSS